MVMKCGICDASIPVKEEAKLNQCAVCDDSPVCNSCIQECSQCKVAVCKTCTQTCSQCFYSNLCNNCVKTGFCINCGLPLCKPCNPQQSSQCQTCINYQQQACTICFKLSQQSTVSCYVCQKRVLKDCSFQCSECEKQVCKHYCASMLRKRQCNRCC